MRKLIVSIALLLGAPSTHAALYSVGLDKNFYTSDFMIGHVVVSVIFPESNGATDPNTETWSDARKTQVLTEIMAGADWWTRQNPSSPLHFTFVSQTIQTRYEPISRPYYDEALWIPDMMGKIGYPGTRFTATRDHVNALRAQHNADWGFVIFVVDSNADTNGKFADGLFAYAYLGGPFMVMTYDNNGYGIGNMDVVAAHEMGHIFHALDEYAGASSPHDYSYGYFPTINGNHAYSTVATDPNSIMRGGIRWSLDPYARKMVGWRDSDNNGRDDILDQSPLVTMSPTVTSSGGNSNFTGNSKVRVLARQGNANGYGLTVDSISGVEYRLRSGNWESASAVDGAFNGPDENFTISITPSQLAGIQSVSSQDLDVRAVTALATWTGSDGSTLGAPGDLENAHAFPNPFKPNSNLGHSSVKFTGMATGTKVQIFSASGEAVFEETAESSANLEWRVVNEQGKALASGVYYYLITDSEGNKKKGKLAVIR